jgi:hypothetical protein
VRIDAVAGYVNSADNRAGAEESWTGECPAPTGVRHACFVVHGLMGQGGGSAPARLVSNTVRACLGIHPAGDVADLCVGAWARERVPDLEPWDASLHDERLGAEATLRHAVGESARTLSRLGSGVGATICSAIFESTSVVAAHVGDGRVYRWREGEGLVQWTADHTFLDPARPHPILLRALGMDPEGRTPDMVHGEVEPGSVYLLCTRGLSEAAHPSVLEACLGSSTKVHEIQHALLTATARSTIERAFVVARATTDHGDTPSSPDGEAEGRLLLWGRVRPFQRRPFLSTFAELAGSTARLDDLVTCALNLLGVDAISDLLIATPSRRALEAVAHGTAPVDPGAERFCRALWVAFRATFDPSDLVNWERSVLPVLGLAVAGALGEGRSIEPVWRVLSIFRYAVRSAGARLSTPLFTDRRDRLLVLQLRMSFTFPDDETFDDIDDIGDLTDDEIGGALRAVWPSSVAWEEHLRVQRLSGEGIDLTLGKQLVWDGEEHVQVVRVDTGVTWWVVSSYPALTCDGYEGVKRRLRELCPAVHGAVLDLGDRSVILERPRGFTVAGAACAVAVARAAMAWDEHDPIVVDVETHSSYRLRVHPLEAGRWHVTEIGGS